MQKIIEVNSIKLPVDFSEKRALRIDKKHLDESSLEKYDLEQYDDDTIFYDVFFDIKNRYLYTIGPPFLNLRNLLFPITCRINNARMRHELNIKEYFNELIAIGRIPLKGLPIYDENRIEFDFNGRFQWSGGIKLNRYEIKPIILTTIQKDNRIQWIEEWMKFYSRNYKISQTIIYDNNSCNKDDLKTIICKNLLVVAWDFKYGPIRSHPNQFCQLGSLNHCRLKFGMNNIIMNFDIDELLILKNLDLRKYKWKYDLVLFDAYRVPFIKPSSEDYSYADFSFRDDTPQNGGFKYFYKPKSVTANNIHDALLEKRPKKIYRKLENIYNRINSGQSRNRFFRCLLYLMSFVLRRKLVPINEGHFLHYTGITNNWKSIYWDRKKEIILSDKHIRFEI